MRNTTSSTLELLHHLWYCISSQRRTQFLFLLMLMVITSFAEVFSIGTILPFLAVLTDPNRIFKHPAAQFFIQLLDIHSSNQLLFALTIVFSFAAIFAGLTRLLFLWVGTRVSFGAGADISIDIYRRTLYQPYSTHIARNSSMVINNIATKTSGVIHGVIVPTMTILSSSIMLVAIVAVLFFVDPLIALLSFGGLGVLYGIIIKITRKRLLADGQRIAQESTLVIKTLQEGLGGIRDVLIDGNQEAYCQIYYNSDIPLRRAQGNALFIGQSPRYIMELLGMLIIAFLAYFLAIQSDGVVKAIPVLGALALGAQRLLPILQQMYVAWTCIQGGRASLQDVLEFLDQPLPSYASGEDNRPISFQQKITVKDLSFRYSDETPWVLKGLNFSLAKGDHIGFVGSTGSGKSTLLDILMGLLKPTYGTIEVDGQLITIENTRGWQAHIAHVPQSIFLADSTIEENIAFGVPKSRIDHERVKQAAEQSQIAKVIESWPNQYQTLVGERGVRLSGGQRQRIGIARALYKQADVIVFDEATSALDNETELAVMQAIESLSKDLTILIIAHRITTLKNCNKIIELSGGAIKRACTYRDLVDIP